MTSWTGCPVPIEERVPLRDRTTWRIGGTAHFYAEPGDREDLAALLTAAERRGLRVRLLGGGSNLLIRDGELDGLVVHLGADGPLGRIQLLDHDEGRLRVGAAVCLGTLLRFAAEKGLTGLEDLAGIPGTVGGAVMMNAGNPARGLGAFVEEVTAVDLAGRVHTLGRDLLHFDYRTSNLEGLVLTDAILRLRPGDPEKIRADMAGFLELKRRRQPLDGRSAGCVFRNPPTAPAGLLIEQAGCKGRRIGDAMVSEAHANFLLNVGDATCDEMRRLIDEVRSAVLSRHRVELKLEVQLWA